MDTSKSLEHGNRCTCKLLAIAIGADPQSLKFNYCHSVLQRRWVVDCNHGCGTEMPQLPPIEAQWHGIGPIDPTIKAVLIMNEPSRHG